MPERLPNPKSRRLVYCCARVRRSENFAIPMLDERWTTSCRVSQPPPLMSLIRRVPTSQLPVPVSTESASDATPCRRRAAVVKGLIVEPGS